MHTAGERPGPGPIEAPGPGRMEQLMEWPLLPSLSEVERREVLTLARRRRFRRGEVIFHEGDPGDTLHLIDRGHVAMRVTTPRGDVATLLVEGPGSHFGELALVSESGTRNSTVVALGATETLSLHRRPAPRGPARPLTPFRTASMHRPPPMVPATTPGSGVLPCSRRRPSGSG